MSYRESRREVEEWLRAHPLRGWAFLATIAICVFYEAYRYPLKINESGISQTYVDTPFGLQVSKYVLLGLVALVLLVGLRRIGARPNLLLLSFCAWAVARGLVGVYMEGDFSTFDATAPFVIGAVIAVMLQVRVPGSLAYLLAAGIVAIHALANLAQIGLYLAIGRLPALAYEADAIKRFGGLWDDPNSVGLFSALFLVYLLVAGKRAYWIAAAAVFNILVSVSFSAALALAVGYCAILIGRRSRLILVAAPVLAAAAVAVFLLPHEILPVGSEWLETKQKSARLRLELTTSMPAPDNFLVGDAVPKSTENSIAAILGASGIVGLGMFLAWIVLACRSTLAANPWAIPVLAGFFAAALVVPFVAIFPIGTLFALFLVQVSGGAEQAP
jgi:hypothetical protein